MPKWWADKIHAARKASMPKPEERFWAKVDKSGGPNACWLWTSPAERKGYGVIWWDGKVRYVHRVSWAIAGRELRDDLVIDHLCRTPKCVNPGHLRLVTTAVNVRSGISIWAINGRKTHCSKGHEFTQENTAHRLQWKAKTRHGHPIKSPRRERLCVLCQPTYWRYTLEKREPPKGWHPRKPWVGPEWKP